MANIVTLTTDYGDREPTVAAVKGALYTHDPDLKVVDLTHEISPGSVIEGALFITFALPTFPKGTVHLVGIAPGPAPIAVTINGQHIVCPDNGLVTLLADRHGIDEICAVPIPDIASMECGHIAYGRDVFAPAAAHLANGVPLKEMGERMEKPVMLDLPRARREGATRIVGEIMHVDRFGNLITNIHRSFIGEDRVTVVETGDFRVEEVCRSYQAVSSGRSLALFGGYDYLEIACNAERAVDKFSLVKGMLVRLTVCPAE